MKFCEGGPDGTAGGLYDRPLSFCKEQFTIYGFAEQPVAVQNFPQKMIHREEF